MLTRSRLSVHLKHINLGISPKELIEFVSEATFGREYAKFVFTRVLSKSIDYLRFVGEDEFNIGPKKLDCLPLRYLMNSGIDVWGSMKQKIFNN